MADALPDGYQLSQPGDIGAELVAKLGATVNAQVQRAIALRIRTKVSAANNDPDASSRRWPFELIQNAHDAGPRSGRDGICLSFRFVDGILRYEHDAAPFSLDEFAALLTGGSSKDFLSTETTGRFGTGFLVTHVLSERVRVSGILYVNAVHRAFEVYLYRPNDEELLLQNVKESQSSLQHTRPVENMAAEPSASLEYVVGTDKIALAGLDALEESLPHLFATCRKLKRITIQRGEQVVEWSAAAAQCNLSNVETAPTELEVVRTAPDGGQTVWRVIRAANTVSASGAVVVALRSEGDNWAVCQPGNLASVYRQLPLLGGPLLPAWIVIDGDFPVEQERTGIYANEEGARALRDAFGALSGLMKLADAENWIDGFRIAQLAVPPEVAGETAIGLWKAVLSETALALSRLSLIYTAHGDKLPCAKDTEHSKHADFIRHSLTGPSHDQLWELAAKSTNSDPPLRTISLGWSEVVEGWEKLGVEPSWIDLKTIGEHASEGAMDVLHLHVKGDPYNWLACYLEAVGRTWQASGTTKLHVSHLLPDQHGNLRDAGHLKRDGGICEKVKEISTSVGLDLGSQLLDLRLVEQLTSNGLASGLYAIKESTEGELREEAAVASLILRLSALLPEDQKVTENTEKAATASMDLLSHLWETEGKTADSIAFSVPIIAADASARIPSRRRIMAPPLAAWPDSARRFIDAFPPARVLSDKYSLREKPLLEGLAAWGIAYPALLLMTAREELTERALKPIAQKPDEVADATLREAKMMQIVLLEPELINYCKQSLDRARALLGLIVCFVAAADVSWRSPVEMSVRNAQGEKRVLLTPTLWLSDVRSKPWIPKEEDGQTAEFPATPTLIRELLDPKWLENNSAGADLLVQHFGIDALDVRLLAAAATEVERQKLRNSLARMLEAAGGSSQFIDEIVIQAQQRQRDVDRMRRLGLAVQECVKVAMERRGLTVGNVDHGYDYFVTDVDVTEDGLGELSPKFAVAGFKVEIKATTTGEAALTPLQARTSASEPDEFVLCVVDLRSYPGDIHEVDWTSEDVSSLCKLVPGRNLPISDTVQLIQSAEGGDIPIRNAGALRYSVGPSLWESGMSFDDWVDATFEVASAVG